MTYMDTFTGSPLLDEEHSYRIVLVGIDSTYTRVWCVYITSGAGGVGKSAVAVRFLREKFVEKVLS